MIIALVILILLTIMSTVFIEKLFRFSQASDGIENSNMAYYSALWIIEETLYGPWVNKYTPWNVSSGASVKNAYTGKTMTVYTGSTSVPYSWRWDSPYDSNYNIIGIGEPVQLVIPNGIDWSSVTFQFRVPKTESGMTDTSVAIWTKINAQTGVILWTLASSWGLSLFASGETNIVQASDINTNWSILSENGTSNAGTSSQFWNFYLSNPWMCTGYACTLKLSMIRSVPTGSNGPTLNFLEYKITGFTSTIPSQYMTLHAEWYSQWFLRTKEIQFPQITTNTALDFAVLQ